MPAIAISQYRFALQARLILWSSGKNHGYSRQGRGHSRQDRGHGPLIQYCVYSAQRSVGAGRARECNLSIQVYAASTANTVGTPDEITDILDRIASILDKIAGMARSYSTHACSVIASTTRSYGTQCYRGYRPFISCCINWLAGGRLPLHAKFSARHYVKFSALFFHPGACVRPDSLSCDRLVHSLEQFAI